MCKKYVMINLKFIMTLKIITTKLLKKEQKIKESNKAISGYKDPFPLHAIKQ